MTANLIVYGDFNCPYSYLASQRVDTLRRLGRATIDWRAVEHDPRLSMLGTPSAAEAETWQRELAEVASLAMPGEQLPVAVPPLVSNTLAAVSAYAEAVTDGVQEALRRGIFAEIWQQQRHLSSAYDVRPLITTITYPPFPILPHLLADLPLPGMGDRSTLHLTRALGGTIAPNGIPLTTTGWRRGQQWRREWLDLDEQLVPTVIDPAGVAWPGVKGLDYLAQLLNDGPAAQPALLRRAS